MPICQFCNKSLSSDKNLKRHQRTTKSCLKIQGKVGKKFACKSCPKKFTSRQSLDYHAERCAGLDATIVKLQKDVKKLKKRQGRKKVKVTNNYIFTNNNYVANFIKSASPVTRAGIEQTVDQLELEHVLDGGAGYARFALANSLDKKVICSDFPRRKVLYRDETGEVVQDYKMNRLGNMFFDCVRHKTDNMITAYLAGFGKRGEILPPDLIEFAVKKMGAVRDSSRGVYSKDRQEFIDYICNHSLPPLEDDENEGDKDYEFENSPVEINEYDDD